ncbi:MAG: alpha/beta hydrolase [Bradyrhizobium sp.]
MTVLKWLVVLAAGGYLVGLAAVFFAQRSFIFPIPQTARTAPEAAGFGAAEEHFLTTADGEKIIVWHVPAKPGHPVVIYFHGNGDFLAGLVGRFRDITSDGTGLVAVSYRGYAGSSGRPSEQGLLRDAAAAYAFASARYGADRIVVWGFSLGSGVAVALAADQPIGKLVLEAPYTSIAEVAGAAFPLLPVRWLIRDQFRSDQRIAHVTAPLLVMHGARDSTISIDLGERLFALANEPKQFVRFAEGGHNDLGDYGAVATARRFIEASNR